MPIFEYQCGKCGAEFEQLVPKADAKVHCGKCGSDNVKKKLSTFAASVSSPKSCPAMSSCPAASGGCAHGGGCCCGGH